MGMKDSRDGSLWNLSNLLEQPVSPSCREVLGAVILNKNQIVKREMKLKRETMRLCETERARVL